MSLEVYTLPTAGRISRCDERYPEFIDHLVFDANAGLSIALGSFEEGQRSDPHPDHCAVSARFRVAPAYVTVPFLVAASCEHAGSGERWYVAVGRRTVVRRAWSEEAMSATPTRHAQDLALQCQGVPAPFRKCG